MKITTKLIAIIWGIIFATSCIAYSDNKTICRCINIDKKIESLVADGDLIYQATNTKQGEFVLNNFGIRDNNCGIIRISNGRALVLTVEDSVKLLPIQEWIRKGVKSQCTVLRFKNAKEILTRSNIQKIKIVEDDFIGKPFDFSLSWSDDDIYPYEMIWKIYKRGANYEINKLLSQQEFESKYEIIDFLRTTNRPIQSQEKYADLNELSFSRDFITIYSNESFTKQELE